MQFKVYRLRNAGRRLPWRQVINGPAYTGELRSHTVERGGVRYNVLSLVQTATPKNGSAIPDLYEPVLLGFAPLAFQLRGYERLGGEERDIGVVQEFGHFRHDRNTPAIPVVVALSIPLPVFCVVSHHVQPHR